MTLRDLPPATRTAARLLAIDATTAEVVRALRASHVPHLLLKGPSFARWLYDDNELRPYADTDLLVPPELEETAEGALQRLGFVPDPGTGIPEPSGVARNHIWTRRSSVVELHVTLVGFSCAPSQVWGAFSASPEPLVVGGESVSVPGEVARTLHVAIHAAQHGMHASQTLRDLEKAVQRVGRSTWIAAADLARELKAVGPFAAGLRLTPAGALLADAMALPHSADPVVALRAQGGPETALGMSRLASLPGMRAKLRYAVRSTFPPPDFMRWWSPLARRSALGLFLAYLARPMWLLIHLPRAFWAWQRAVRASQRG